MFVLLRTYRRVALGKARDLVAGAAEAFTWSADDGGAEHASRRREHAVGTSQLTDLHPNAQACALGAPELAASGCGQRAQASSHRPAFARSASARSRHSLGGGGNRRRSA